MAKYKIALTKTIDDDDPLMDFCFDDESGKLAPVELMADELKRMFDLGYVDALDVLQDMVWSVVEVDSNLATTIPPDKITHGVGEPVFPALYEQLADYPAALELAKQREQFGIAKYGQTLMTGDDRNTDTEIANEQADTLAYMQKHIMQYGFDDWIGDLLLRQIELCEELLHYLDAMRDTRWTQDEIDAAEAKVPALRDALGIE